MTSNWQDAYIRNGYRYNSDTEFANGSGVPTWNIVYNFKRTTFEPVKIEKALDPEMKECPVTFELITGDYIQCSGCHKCFDISVRQMWIMVHHTCPHCRMEWKKDIIYSQSTVNLQSNQSQLKRDMKYVR